MAASDAIPVPRKFTAYRITFPIHDSAGNPVTGAGSLDSEVSVDGAAFADATNEATEIGNGIYYLDLDTGEMQGDTVAVAVKSDQKQTNIVIYPEEVGDIRVDVRQIDGDTGAADILGKEFVDTGYALRSNVEQVNGDTGAAAHLAQFSDEYDTGRIAAEATATLDTGGVNNAVWNGVRADHAIAGTFGEGVGVESLAGDTGAANHLRQAIETNAGGEAHLRANVVRWNDSGVETTAGGVKSEPRVNVYHWADTGVEGYRGKPDVNVTHWNDSGTEMYRGSPDVNVWAIHDDTGKARRLEQAIEKNVGGEGHLRSNVVRWNDSGVETTAGAPKSLPRINMTHVNDSGVEDHQGAMDVNIWRIHDDTGAARHLESAFNDTGVHPVVNVNEIDGDTGAAANLRQALLDTGVILANINKVKGDTGVAANMAQAFLDTGLVLADVQKIDGDTGAATTLQKRHEDTGIHIQVDINQVDGDTGAASRLQKLAGTKLTDSGTLDTGTITVNAVVDTGEVVNAVWGANKSDHEADTGAMGYYQGNTMEIRGDTGAASNMQRQYNTTQTYFPFVDIFRIDGDTGAATNLRRVYQTNQSFWPLVDIDRVDGNSQAATNLLHGLGDTGGIQVDLAKVDGDTGAAANLLHAFQDTGLIAANVDQIDGDTGAADNLQKALNDSGTRPQVDVHAIVGDTGAAATLQKRHADTGVHIPVNVNQIDGDTGAADLLAKAYQDTGVATVTANINAINGDTGAAQNLAAIFADTGYTLRANVEQIDGDTGAADRLGKLAGDKLSATGAVDTGTLEGTRAGTIDANVTHVNETKVAGTGASGDEWGPE
jgi:hypothetical protein